MPGMPAFWAPAGPQPRRLTWGRARARQRTQKQQPKKSSPQASPETQTQQTHRNIAAFCGWGRARVRARHKARKPTGKKQGLRSARASRSKSKTDRTTAQRSAQQFFSVFTAFGERGPSIGANMRKNEPRLYPSDTFLKTVLHGLRGFFEGSLDDAGAEARPNPRP